MGDSITWTFSSLEIHTVTFLSGADRIPDLMPLPDGRLAFNPDAAFPSGGTEYDGSGILNSGILSLDPMTGAVPTYTLDFTAAGTFPYVCLIHPLMIARVNVVEADASFSGTQADIDAAAEQDPSGPDEPEQREGTDAAQSCVPPGEQARGATPGGVRGITSQVQAPRDSAPSAILNERRGENAGQTDDQECERDGRKPVRQIERASQRIDTAEYGPRRNQIDPQYLPETFAMDFAYEALEWTVGHGGQDGSLPPVAASGDRPLAYDD